MRKLFLFFLLIFLENAQGQTSSPEDSLCKKYHEAAKRDYDLGELRLCVRATWDVPFSRMYTILDTICRNSGLILTPYPYTEHDFGFDPYTCYSKFMDSIVEHKYKENIKTRLYQISDSIYKERHKGDTLPSYYCDKPSSYYKGIYQLEKDFFKIFSLPQNCKFLSRCSDCVFRVIFLVDLNGRASDYKIYHTDFSKKNCGSAVREAIRNTLRRISGWRPGVLGNRGVASFCDISIDIANRRIR